MLATKLDATQRAADDGNGRSMSRHDKRIAKIRENIKHVRFDDLVRVVEHVGWSLRKTAGSHQVFVHADHPDDELVIVRPHGNHKFCHPDDVRGVLARIETDDDGGDNDEE